jgi:hypothetical protein
MTGEPDRGKWEPCSYQIHRYPADLIDVVRLAGGAHRVVIRPVLPQDEDLTSAFFGDLPARRATTAS